MRAFFLLRAFLFYIFLALRSHLLTYRLFFKIYRSALLEQLGRLGLILH